MLALRAAKDVKVGQFFTPENVVRFMVKLAELDYKDMVLDPACGTGRFLIYAMDDMLEKVDRSDARNKASEREQVRLHRLFGADIDPRIGKIAKMNMWVHGDGKANIFGGPDFNGLTLHKHSFDGHDSFDDAFDVMLTNPPLGDLNYESIEFVSEPESEQERIAKTLERMFILPHKNLTEHQLNKVRERLQARRNELTELDRQISLMEGEAIIREWLRLSERTGTSEERARKRELQQADEVKAYKKLCSAAKRKWQTIERNVSQEAELDAQVRMGEIQWEITGSTMKGGAMFLAAIWHYLKAISYPDNPPEWRGGKVLIILDEGNLNTDNYSTVRKFLRTHFYIKAIISLTRDTFVPISKTSTKTSVVYAVKKIDFNAVQKEPVFLGHVEHVGFDTKGKVCANDFEAMQAKYFDFKRKGLASYVGAEFRPERFLEQGFEGGSL